MAKIYQLYYTRLGKQGSNAGWQVASASAGVPQLVKNTFYKLASNLVTIGAKPHVPPMAFDLQIMENYVFLSHINYNSVNQGSETDIRGVSFIHGFAVRVEEYRELVREPEKFLGISGDAVVLNYNGQKELPLLEAFPCRPLSQREILAKYRLDQDRFYDLMDCVYAVMNMVGGSLVVKWSECHGEKQRTLFQEMLCVIMQNLPYILRMKVSAFSGIRQGAMVCFCDELPESGNWYDLDTGEFQCPEPIQYDFITDAGNLAIPDETKKQFYSQLEEFIDVTYGGKYDSVRLNHVELAYRGIWFQNMKPSEEEVDAYIKEAVSLKAYKYDKLDLYYAKLIGHYLGRNREFPSPEVLKRLQRRYIETSCRELKEAFAGYYTAMVCHPGAVPAYEMLYRLESLRPEDYRDLVDRLLQIRPTFLDVYHIDYYLEKRVTDYESLERTCREEERALEGPAGGKLMEIMTRIFQEELGTAQDNSQRHEICKRYTSLCRSFPQSRQGEADACIHMFCDGYWNSFNEEEFSYKKEEEYWEMIPEEDGSITVPENVCVLLDARANFFKGPDIEEFERVFLTDEVIPGEAERKNLVRELREQARKQRNLPLDAFLLLNYRAGSRFDLNLLARDMENSRMAQAGGAGLDIALERSRVLVPGSEAEAVFVEQLKTAVKDKNSHALIKEFYKYYFPPKEAGSSLADLVQKCLLFLAVALTYVVMAKYLMGENAALGLAAAGIGGAASAAGLAVNLKLGRTNCFELIARKDAGAIRWLAVFAVVAAAVVAAAVLVSEIWMTYIMGAAVAALLAGRILIIVKMC